MEAVFEVLADHERYAEWCRQWDQSTVEAGHTGVGTRRSLRNGSNGNVYREEVNLYWPPRMLGYRMLDEDVLADHQGVVVLTPAGPGTEIFWQFSANIAPGSNLVPDEPAMTRSLQGVVDDLAAECVRRQADSAQVANHPRSSTTPPAGFSTI
jgi:hypothetical protein